MHRATAWAVLLALGGMHHSLPAQIGGNDKGIPVVQRASRAYQALSSFQAQFLQHFEDKNLDMADAKGTLYQEGKNHFAMRFSDPPKDAIVVDGTKVWMYLPSSSPGRVLRFPQPNHPTYGTNLLGTFLDNAVDRYRITYVRSESIDGHVTDAVIMEPIAKDMQFLRATVWFDRELGLPRRLDIEETRDHKRVLYLTQLHMNESIAPDMFICNQYPAKTTKIIDQ
jgi:outer membrane lipoprotein carrier protein